jgi:hypothetical protein
VSTVSKTFAKLFRCKLLNVHDWRPLRIAGEKAWECRNCGELYGGAEPPKYVPTDPGMGGA